MFDKKTRSLIVTTIVFHLTIFDCFIVTKKTPIGEFHGISHSVLRFEVHAYQGIPYAESPVHDKRFKEVSNFKSNLTGLYNQSTPCCSKQILFEIENNKISNDPLLEDCLSLNIWQPESSSETKYPVVVWIHGGDFSQGTFILDASNAAVLAARLGVVVVSLNYRLGALGFLSTDDDFAPGNVGLKDQVLALKWIHKNIKYFGGDADRITVIGQSAGSASVGYHLLSADTSKLFQRAILMSGTPNSEKFFMKSEDARSKAFELASKLGSESSNYENMKRFLMKSSYLEILRKQNKISNEKSFCELNFGPTIDSTLVLEHPVTMLKNAKHLKDKEILISWTKDEGSHLLASKIKLNTNSKINEHQYEDFMRAFSNNDDNITESILKLYEGQGDYIQRLKEVVGDYCFKCPSLQFAEELRQHGAIVFQSEFNHRTRTYPEWMGVVEGADLEVMFWDKGPGIELGLQKTLRNYISEFVHLGGRGLENKLWKRDKIFSIGSKAEVEADTRIRFCKTLKEVMPHYLSGATFLFGRPAVLILIAHIVY